MKALVHRLGATLDLTFRSSFLAGKRFVIGFGLLARPGCMVEVYGTCNSFSLAPRAFGTEVDATSNKMFYCNKYAIKCCI